MVAKFQKPRLLSEKEINIIRGKASVGHASVEELQQVFGHIDTLEWKMDEDDGEDFFGTEGWRHRYGHPDSD